MDTLTQSAIDPELPAPDARHLEAVLQSQCFERSPKLRTLFTYLWEHRNEDISEYAIAVDALERGPDFDSKIDATVRVQIARLRKLLKKYYEEEGSASEIRIVIPLGTHRIDCENLPTPDKVRDSTSVAMNASARLFSDDGQLASMPVSIANATSRSSKRWASTVLVSAIAVLVLISSLVWLSTILVRRKESTPANANQQQIPSFWKGLENGRATRIVLPTPVFFTWRRQGQSSGLMARDVSVNESAKLTDSSYLAKLKKQLGEPKAWQDYTVASDTVATLQLVEYLNKFGLQERVSTSADLPQQMTNNENIIAFGATSDLTTYKADSDRLTYQLGSNEEYVIDTHETGERHHEFVETNEPGSLVITPGLIALIPRGNSGNWLLLIQGVQNAALISYLISDNGMREIEQARARYGHTKFFEAVVLSEVNGDKPIQSSLAAFRPFPEALAETKKQ